jgi:hypothetical protein
MYKDCTCTHVFWPFDRQIGPRRHLHNDGPKHDWPRLVHRIQTLHCSCSMTPRMSVWLWGACDLGRVYVASSAAPSYAADDTVARDYRRTSRRSIAHKRFGSRVRPRTLEPGRVAALKTLEGALLSLMLASASQRKASATQRVSCWAHANSPNSSAFRNHGSENRLASETCHLSNSVTTFDSGLKKPNATSRTAPIKPLDFSLVVLYAAYSHDWQGNLRA